MSNLPAWLHRKYERWKLDTMSQSDFRPGIGILKLSLMAVFVGVAAAFIAYALYRMIGLVTNISFRQEFSSAFLPPALHASTLAIVLAPLAGGLIVGLIARYGSDRIRGHGIPEALEAILFRKSKMMAKVAILKPLSAAIAIGTGGPFGAEGPIIMTGGAMGSLFGQMFYLTAMERRTLLVAGACAGMSATFGTPIAATLLAVELLLFELRPRSTIPVAIACFVADALRIALLGSGALFPLAAIFHPNLASFASAAVCGFLAGLMATLLTALVYRVEDAFHKLPVHWMWWPLIGAVAVSVGGLIEPQALGVGYDVIGKMLTGQMAGTAILAFMLVKSLMWSIYLGSGTSGGVLAPLLAMGAGLGGLEAMAFPGSEPLLWPLLSMGAMLAGVMRLPFTSIMFALELTHNASALPVLLVSCTVAYGVSVFLMRRSILTEKIARRGLDIFREYSVDRLEHTPVREVMTTEMITVPGGVSVRELAERYFGPDQPYRAFPVVDADGALLGVVDRRDVQRWLKEDVSRDATLASILDDGKAPVIALPDESCQGVAVRMAVETLDRIPIVDADRRKLLGMVTRYDLLKPYTHYHDQERVRERFFLNGNGKIASNGE